jgi:SNF2 family DNA or RNA helicase
MFRIMAGNLVLHEKIETTDAKAKELRRTVEGGEGSLPVLAALTLLRRLCNSPDAFFADAAAGAEEGDEEAAAVGAAASYSQSVVAQLQPLRTSWILAQPPELRGATTSSGKMTVLAALLASISRTTSDRVVVVAGWTHTLTLVAALCAQLGLGTARLDGSTPADSAPPPLQLSPLLPLAHSLPT